MRLHLTLLCALALTACNAFSDSPADETSGGRESGGSSSAGFAPPAVSFVGGPAVPGGNEGVVFGPVVTSEVPPAPIQGGTLLMLGDGHTAVAADPDRDRVLIADVRDGEVLATLELRPGDEPGRLVEDAAGRVHIVLRRTGVIATLDVATRALVDRRDVCLAPQGIAYAKDTDSLLVACTEGDLVELPAAGGNRSRVTHVDADLRDVMVVGSRVLVSRFKTAELLELDSDRLIARRSRAGEITGPFNSPFGGMAPQAFNDDGTPQVSEPRSFSAGVAFRTLADANGQVVMLHQRSQSTEIDLQDGGDPHDPTSGGAGSDAPPPEVFDDASGGDPYGGGAGDLCGSIVRPALSAEHDGKMASGPVLPAATLAVDAAFSPDGRWVAVGVAGSPDSSQKSIDMISRVSAIVVPMETVMTSVTAEGEVGSCPVPTFDSSGGLLSSGQVVAVAFDSDNRLVMQTREPSALHIFANFDGCFGENCTADSIISFGGESRADTGHDLFHGDAGSGIACASCHPGGADDGHTWVFSGQGARRTQLFNMGIANTLPLHWDGTLATFSDLVSEVFVRRMGGAQLGVPQVQAMEGWMSTLEPGTPLHLATDPAVERGKLLFDSAAAGCTSCHTGSMFTNNKTVDVGTGGAFQVPSLIGVAHHAPWIHTGCAATLRDRFDPACGGDKHGNVAGLDDGQIDDLVAYLESL